MEREQAKQTIGKLGWLARLPETHRSKILSRSVLKKFNKEDAIYVPGDPPAGMYGLVTGTLSIVAAPEGSNSQLLHTALPGFWFGEGPAISGAPRRVGVTARSDVTALHLSLRAIKEMTNDDPTMWRSIALNALLSFDLAVRALHDARLPDAHVKVSTILLRLAGHRSPDLAVGAPRTIEITQTELADIAGLSRNVINRVLRELSKKALVTVGYGFIELPDPELLTRRLTSASGP